MPPALFPNITFPRVQLERIMTDECVITRDKLGFEDDTFDRVTGRYMPGAVPAIYDADALGEGGRSLAGTQGLGGKLFLKPVQNRADIPRTPAGLPQITRQYVAKLPWDAPDILPGDSLLVVYSARDDAAAGKTFVCVTTAVRTINVARVVDLEEIVGAFPGIRGG